MCSLRSRDLEQVKVLQQHSETEALPDDVQGCHLAKLLSEKPFCLSETSVSLKAIPRFSLKSCDSKDPPSSKVTGDREKQQESRPIPNTDAAGQGFPQSSTGD